MINIYLKFTDRNEAIVFFDNLNMVYNDSIENIKLIEIPFICDLIEVKEIFGIDGWHVNLKVDESSFDLLLFDPFRVYPKTPICVWA